MRSILVLTAALPVALLAGCPQPVSVVAFVNDTVFPIQVVAIYSDESLLSEELLNEFGQRVELEIGPGETRTFSRPCRNFEALLVEGELDVLGNIGPEESTGVLRNGQDFDCKDVLVFRFTASAWNTDLDIDVRRN